MFAVFLTKFCEIGLLATIIAVPLLYQLSLSEEAIASLRLFFGDVAGAGLSGWIARSLGGEPFFWDQVFPYFGGLMPVLESKLSVWIALGAPLIVVHVLAILLRGFIGKLKGEADPEAVERRPLHRSIPLLAILAFLAYSFASILLWPPQVPAETAFLSSGSEGGGWAARLGGGSFFHSVTAWLQVAFVLVFFLVAEDLIRSRRLVYKILILFFAVGLLNALVVVLQKVEFQPIVNVWVQFNDAEARNNLGAFIGHNTGVSSFLVLPTILAITWLLGTGTEGGRTVRVLMGTSCLLFALALIVAQSRAIVPIILVAIPGLIWFLRRRAALEVGRSIAISLALIVGFAVTSQLLPSRFNPLYRRDVPLVRRVQEFTPTRLLTETRLRILVVSLNDLVPVYPLLGSGWGTFHYVYPKAQGEYFERNPRSRLAPTAKRSFHAHNEYLQTLIETGIIGLGIALVGLGALVWGGLTILRRTLLPHHLCVQAAIFVSMAALLAHSAVDFPLRIPPITLTLVMLMAIWSAGDRLWIFTPRDPALDFDAESPEAAAAPRTRLSRVLMTLGAVFSTAVVLLALAGTALLLAKTAMPFLASRALVLRGESHLVSASQTTQREASVSAAMADARAAKRIFWVSGPVHRLHAQVQYHVALINYRLMRDMIRDANAATGEKRAKGLQLAGQLRSYAETIARTGISDINQTLAEENFDQLYSMRAGIYELMATYATPEEKPVFEQARLDDLTRAVAMNAANPETVMSLLRILEQDTVLNRREIVRLYGIMHHFDRGAFERNIFSRVHDALALDEPEEAVRWSSLVREATADQGDLYLPYLAAALQRFGEYERADEMAAQFLQRNPTLDPLDIRRLLVLSIPVTNAAMQRHWDAAARGLERVKPFREEVATGPLLALDYMLARSRQPDAPEVASLRAKLLERAKSEPALLQIVASTAWFPFSDAEETIHWLNLRIEAAKQAPDGPQADQQTWVTLAKALAQAGRWDEVAAIPPANFTKDAPTNYARNLGAAIAERLASQMPLKSKAP